MTIIVSYQHNDSLVMLGDLIVSKSGKAHISIPRLPARFSEKQPEINSHIIGLTQKIICVSDRLAVAWAGNTLVARHLIAAVRDNIGADFAGSKILEIIRSAGLSENELRDVSFIFFSGSCDGKQIQVQDYLVKEVAATPFHKFKFAGSGDYHFFETIAFENRFTSDEAADFTKDLVDIVVRLSRFFTRWQLKILTISCMAAGLNFLFRTGVALGSKNSPTLCASGPVANEA